MDVCFLKDAPCRCWGWGSVRSWSLSPVPLNPGFWHSNELPTPESHFPHGQKVKAHLSLFPRYHGDPCKLGGERQTKKTQGGKRVEGEKEAVRGLGQGRQTFTMNLHWVCYRWYRPPRTIVCLGFPKQRWTGTPVYTGLFCSQLLESLLLVYYLRLPWV